MFLELESPETDYIVKKISDITGTWTRGLLFFMYKVYIFETGTETDYFVKQIFDWRKKTHLKTPLKY